MTVGSSFMETFGLDKGGVVSIVGAGGKTSLMFHLARESSNRGYRTYVSTTTKMLIPTRAQCDEINFSGSGYIHSPPQNSGVYVAGVPLSAIKIQGLSETLLTQNSQLFDITLLEADGAAKKSLKGWLPTEPVIPTITTHTIGVVDVGTVGQIVSPDLVHRLDLFCNISGARKGEAVTVQHLKKMITHQMGLFFQAKGKKLLFINKVESPESNCNAEELIDTLVDLNVYTGSVQLKKILTKA